MKYLNHYNGALTEGFFDFFKKPDEQTVKKRELLRIITECCHNGLTFYNSTDRNQPRESTDVIRNKYKGPMYIIVNDDLSVSFNGNVSLYGWKKETFPFKFKKIQGDFHMERCSNLSTLDFLPETVTKKLDISDNGIDSLETLATKFVGKSFNCNGNNLQTLNNLPTSIGGEIHAQTNDICNFDGIDFKYLKKIDLYLNPVSSINGLWDFLKRDQDAFDLFKEYDPIRPAAKQGEKPCIIKDRLDEFLQCYNKKIILSETVQREYDII